MEGAELSGVWLKDMWPPNSLNSIHRTSPRQPEVNVLRMTRLSKTFRSRKNPYPISPEITKAPPIIIPTIHKNDLNEHRCTEIASSSHHRPPPESEGKAEETKKKIASQWSVYLIISSRLPKTYVGVTTNFPRRLKQHNGELRGGAKASTAGRPWTLACIVRGFKDRSEACEFEYKWKSISRKLPRKKSKEDQATCSLLQHRAAALSKVNASLDCGHLQIEWKSSSA